MRLRSISVVLVLGSWLVRPSIDLGCDSVAFPGESPNDIMSRFRERLGNKSDIVAAEQDRMVAHFAGKAGPVPYKTLEIVGFEKQRVSFEHLTGPFLACTEAFEIDGSEEGSSVTHAGQFTMRGGLLGWVLGRLWVLRLFRQHVKTELEQMAGSTLS